MRALYRCAGVVLALVGALAGCGSDTGAGPGGGGGAGACALVAQFRGRHYEGMTVAVAPTEGKVLGEAVLPGCDDTGEGPEPAERFPVARFEGLSPDDVLTWPGRSDTVLVRRGLEQLPPEVARLQSPPACDAEDEPIELMGPWLGILGADQKTELDLEPPYDIDLFVEEASPSGYAGAYLTVRVPPKLGRPIDKSDVRASLWEGGGIAITTECGRGGYVATAVRVYPPG